MSKRLHYLPRLNGLRAIAAFMVLVCHFLIDLKGPRFDFWGNGVDIFFVISGFLITSILLAQKAKSSLSKGRQKRAELKMFTQPSNPPTASVSK